VTVFVLTGVIVTLFRRAFLWLTASYLIVVLLFAVANGAPVSAFRDAITGLWYNDAFRLAALLPMVATPLAVLGLLTAIRALQRLTARVHDRYSLAGTTRSLTIGVVTVVCVAVAAFATQDRTIHKRASDMSDQYRISDMSALLTPDERAFFSQVSRLVPPGDVIAGNPWNGSSLVYAYENRPALFPHVGGSFPQEYWDLASGLADGTPAACAAARDLQVKYVLDFGSRFLFVGDRRALRFAGLTSVGDSSVLTLLSEHAGLKLFKVTGCAAS